MLAAAVKNLTDFQTEKFALGRKRTAFGEHVQRENHLRQPVIPADSGFCVLLDQPFASLADVALRRRQDDDLIMLHRGERGILCLARIRSKTLRAGSPLPAFISSKPRWMPRIASSMSSNAAASCTINSARPLTVRTSPAGVFEPAQMRLGVALKIRQRPDVLQGNHNIELTVLTMLH